MSRRIVTRPRFSRDLVEQFAFIAADKLAPAERFLKVAADSIERLADMPGIGRVWESPLPHLAGVRVYPMPSGFRSYLIFYRLLDGGIELLALIHGSRDLAAVLDSLSLDET
jgi:toxin ParE1/3/4